eukprot:6464995-Amphidinium_carterae.1
MQGSLGSNSSRVRIMPHRLVIIRMSPDLLRTLYTHSIRCRVSFWASSTSECSFRICHTSVQGCCPMSSLTGSVEWSMLRQAFAEDAPL